MGDEVAPCAITLVDGPAAFARLEAKRCDATPDEIGRRALALYAIVIEHLERGDQILIQYLPPDDSTDLVRLLRLDALDPPVDQEFGDVPAIDERRLTRTAFGAWPPIV